MRRSFRIGMLLGAIMPMVWAGPALAAQVLVEGTGAWDNASPTSTLTKANTNFSFSFVIEQAIAFNPTTDFSAFQYILDGQSVATAPTEISFFSASAGGGIQLTFPNAFLIGFGAPLLDSNGALTILNAPMDFATDEGGLSFGTLAVKSTATAAVPEPSVWLMMIVGFGIVGMGLRRRRCLPSLGTA